MVARGLLGAAVLAVALACANPMGEPPPPPPAPEPAPPPRPKKDQVERQTIQVGGVERTFWLHVPAGATGALPMVMAFHGGAVGDGRKMVSLWDHWFDRGVILVFPDGKAGEDDGPMWSGIGRDGSLQDVEFARAVVNRVSSQASVDQDRIFATGFSSGAFLTWQLACLAQDVFDGFAPVGHGMPRELVAQCKPVGGPKPLLYAAGTDDPKSIWTGREEVLAATEGVELFLDKNGCDRKSGSEILLDDLALDDGTRVKRHDWTCPETAKVRLFEITGGGHAWPRKDAKGDRACRDIDAADEIMAFFGIDQASP